MRIIIAGSRSFANHALLKRVMDRFTRRLTKPFTVLSGHAAGADKHGEQWALAPANTRRRITLEIHHPEWRKEGRAAGILRNRRMAESADAAVVFWDGVSGGARNMIEVAKRLGLKLKVVRF